MKNPLLDQEFLRKLDLTKNKTTYAKIILLTREENPVYEVQGKITSGSVSIDGNSAVRRTCSLSMVSPDVDITNTYWALKNKFKLEVGVENAIDTQYPDIIWFKQGTFVFTSLNMNVQSNNFTISINGKDKMCLLNGEVGGSLNASTDFGQLEEYEKIYSEVEVDADDYVPNVYYYLNGYGEYILDSAEEATADRKYYSMEIIRTLTSLSIVDIIKNVVQYYAGEPLNNIVINDVDDYGLELLEYRGDSETPMYLLRDKETCEVSNMTFSKEYKGCEPDNKDIEKTYIFGEGFEFYNQSGTITNLNQNPSSVYANVNGEKREYNVIKIEFGMTAGYRRTALTYPGELVGAVGASITSAVLDKIKNMFSDFEYFYDIDGKFIFQKKKTYLNTSFSNLVAGESEVYAEDAKYTSAVTYSFENGLLLSAFTDAPQILNIKNDFSIWGVRDGVASANIPVHMRYAIDTKPVFYRPIRFEFQEIALDEATYETNKFYIKNADGKYVLSSAPYKTGIKYYEESEKQDLSVDAFEVPTYDWRELIYQMALDYFKYEHKKHNFTQLVAAANPTYYPTGMTGYENYYTDLQGFWRQLYNPEAINAEVYDYFLDSTVDKNTDFNSGNYFIKKNDEYKKAESYDEDGITNPNIYIYDEDLNTYSKIPNPDLIDFTKPEIFNRYYYKPNEEKEEYIEIKYYKDIKNNKIKDVFLYQDGSYVKVEQELTKDNFIRYYIKASEGGYVKVDKFEDLKVPRWYYTYKEEFKKETKSLNETNFNDKDYYIKEESEYIPAEYYMPYNEVPLTYYTATTKNNQTTYKKVDKQLSAEDFDSENDKKYYIQTKEGHYVRATSYNPKQVPIDYYYREGKWTQTALKESNQDIVYIKTTRDYYEKTPKYMPILHYEFINNQYIPVASIASNKTYYVKINNRFYPISWIYQSSKEDNGIRKDWKALSADGLTIKSDNKYAYAIRTGEEDYVQLDKATAFEIPEYYQVQYIEHSGLDKIIYDSQDCFYKINDKYYPLQLYYKYKNKYVLEIQEVNKINFSEKTYYIKTNTTYKKLTEFPTTYCTKIYQKIEQSEIPNKFGTSDEYYIKTFSSSTSDNSYYKKPNEEDHKEKTTMPQTYYYYDDVLEKFIKEEKEINIENPDKDYYILNYVKANKFESIIEPIETYYIKNEDKYEKATNISINDFFDRVIFEDQTVNGEKKLVLNYYIYQDSGYTKIENFNDMKNDKDFKKKKYYIGFNLDKKEMIYKRLSSVPKTQYDLPTKDLPTFYLFENGEYIERRHGEKYKIENDDGEEITITYNIVEETRNLYVKTENSGYYIKSEDSYYPVNDYMVKEIPQTYYYLTHEGQYIKENIELTEELFNEKTYYKKAEIYTEIISSAMTQIPETYYKKKRLEYVELDIDGVTKGSFSIENGFSEAVNNSPETLNFWFDFLDTNGELSKYSISAIGCRPKAVNNNKIKAIYFQETPTVLFLTEEDYEELVNNRQDYMDMTGYTFIQLTDTMENYFSISAQGISAKNELDNLLYQHTYATETVNLTSVPIYHLQPNTRIFVKDDNTGINGEFIVSKITVPLQYNGTTAITTVRAVERIY